MSPPSSPATVPPSAAGSRARFPHLDALRGIAALSVAGFHFASEMPGTWFTALFSKGWLGVEVFFVISGFILPCALQARGSYSFPRHYPHFLWKRILRLHPPYLVTLGIVLATWYGCSRVPGLPVSALAITWQEVAAHPFLLNDVLGLRWVSDVFWTLAIEFQFYLLIGALFPLLANRGRWLPAVVVLILAGLLPVPRVWLVPYLPVFALGILAWKVMRDGASPRVVCLLGGAAAMVAARTLGIPAALVGAATALAVVWWRRGVPRWLMAAGTVSYSLYLLHASIGGSVLQWARRYALDEVPAQVLAFAAALAASWVAALALYRLVERPALRWSAGRTFRD